MEQTKIERSCGKRKETTRTMNKILETTKFVVDNSGSIKLNREKVKEFSQRFDHGATTHWLNAAPFGFSKFNDEQRLHFLFIFNALSFCYWGEPKWTIEHDGRVYDGAWGLIVALHRAIEEGIPLLDFSYCAEASKDNLARILRGNVEVPLLEERSRILNEIGSVTINVFGGKLENLIKSASGDAMRLLDNILAHYSSFQDESVYQGKQIFFEKRAQLLTNDIYRVFRGRGFGNLKNVDQLTACADYKLPQILRRVGIFSYNQKLAQKIDAKTELPHGSEEEVGIRANTIWAVEYIKEEVAKRGAFVTSMEIDDHLWLATQEKFLDDKPYHRTRTIAY